MALPRLAKWLSLTGIKPVAYVPLITFAFQPEDASSGFIAQLFASLPDKDFGQIIDDPAKFSEVELNLKEAASMRARWTSYSHVSYPMWVLGNLYLVKGLSSGAYNLHYLICANSLYTKAVGFMRPGDNPELYAALYNNLAFLNFVHWSVNGNDKFKKKQCLAFLDTPKISKLASTPLS